MMGQIIPLRKFGGLVTSIAQDDIDVQASPYCQNIDPEYRSQLKGIPDNGDAYKANLSDIPDVFESGFIKYDDSGTDKWDLVYIDKNQNYVIVIENFHGLTAVSRTLTNMITNTTTPVMVGTANCIKIFNNAAQIGVGTANPPYMVHRLINDKKFWNNNQTATAGLYAEFSYCKNGNAGNNGEIYITAVADTAGVAPQYFSSSIRYAWGISVVYDGIQESNLVTDTTNASSVPAADAQYYTVSIKAKGGDGSFSTFDSRITAIKIYRAESSDTDEANLGLYRLVKVIDINDSGWAVDGTDATYSYQDDGGYPEGGATYEEETGILETTSNSYVHYDLNEVGGGYHWMAKCYVPYTQSDADWDRYIFRSKKFRPNMVDWVRDFVVIPEIPTDLVYYNDKLYVFSENNMHRVNPELLVIEQSFEGMGVAKRGGALATDYGLVFANINGVYVTQGGMPARISDLISEYTGSYSVSWKRFAYNTLENASASYLGRIIVGYLAPKRCILFIGNDGTTSTTVVMVFYLPTKEWFLWTLGDRTLDSNSGLVTGKDGELYFSNATDLKEILGGTGNENFFWVSKEFTLDEPSQKKSWNKLKWDATAGTGSITIKYATDGSDPITGTTATNDTYINTYAKTFQIYVNCTGNAKVDSIDILVRKLLGQR